MSNEVERVELQPLEQLPDEGITPEDIRRKFEEASDEIGRFNLAIFGQTGVGKSTLINTLFGKEVAKTGMGRPCTPEGHLYVHETNRFGLYDTRGLEINDDPGRLLEEFGRVLLQSRGKPLSEQIHLAYFCVNVHTTKLQKSEDQFIQGLHDLGLPVILVATKCDSPDGLVIRSDLAEVVAAIENEAQAAQLGIFENRVFPICAIELSHTQRFGLEELLDATFRAAPEGVEAALNAAQVLDFARKAERAKAIIAWASAAAGATGATPIPFADAPLLAATQLKMMAKISSVYGISISTGSQAAVVASTAAIAIGKSMVGGLLKMIPGVGTITGGFISAGVASTLTLAMGKTWNRLCQMHARGELDLELIADHELVGLFKQILGGMR